ncbi:zonular occludens toxin domain-containing protein [Vibrio parahaemolyticus]|uniref:zonular occludens toxin domain-containing protein n=2 Tax=Vibrio parahaemolyticus TaxID=670 RepID=UPI0011237354|nr:zonular occludens toxin domain-containing protein [Vibrio parahaemolyticus]MBE3958584.1 assembly protein [Vibrio parahaemolyticus]MBE3967621.1 assembly protein [Vibrio parahaemolyticus]MBE3998723.1 assembly protein [Vibrio parahaemolyticus]MBE4016983.1 assembly protein [Vibrio parahaemolyticus]MBE4024913.1 assembly protein [Vibrio parahaemolyticus]
MIYAICGRPRSGKSYESVVYHILPAVKSGRKVITNVTINIDWFVKVLGEPVRDLIVIVDGQLNEFGKLDRPFSKFEHYQDDWRDEKNRGPLFVIDEAHMVLPNRNLDASILEFYSLHGHYGIDIYLLTQDLRKIHRDIKAMIEMTYYCAKNTAFGSDKTYTKKVRIGATTEVVNEEVRKYKASYFPAYQSHTQSNGSVAEVMANDIKPIWKRWPFYGAAIFLSLGVASLIYLGTGIFSEPEVNQVKKIDQVKIDVPNSPGQQRVVSKRPSRDFGPLNGYEMVVTGYSKQVAYTRTGSSSGQLDRDLTFYKIYVSVLKDSQKIFDFEHLELEKMGYTFTALSECVYQVTWMEESKIVTCNTSTDERSKPESPLDMVNTVTL